MNQATVRYCENCGKPLKVQARFCEHCGHAAPQENYAPAQSGSPAPVAQSTPAAQPAAASQPTETIVAVLPAGTRRSSFLGLRAKSFILVLTNLRILFVQQTSQMMKENARQAKQAAKQSGAGFFGQLGAIMVSHDGRQYLKMDPQEILNETAGNYFIANNQIRSIRIKDGNLNEVKLTLNTVSGKIKMIHAGTNTNEIKQTLQQTLGDLVR